MSGAACDRPYAEGAEDTTVVSNDKTNQPDSGVTAANYIAP